jgi:hypothetical protein
MVSENDCDEVSIIIACMKGRLLVRMENYQVSETVFSIDSAIIDGEEKSEPTKG